MCNPLHLPSLLLEGILGKRSSASTGIKERLMEDSSRYVKKVMGGVILALNFLNHFLSIIYASIGVNFMGITSNSKENESSFISGKEEKNENLKDNVFVVDDDIDEINLKNLQSEYPVSNDSFPYPLFDDSEIDGSTFFGEATASFDWLSILFYLNSAFSKLPVNLSDTNSFSQSVYQNVVRELALRLICLNYPLSEHSRSSQIVTYESNINSKSENESGEPSEIEKSKLSFLRLAFPISPCYVCYTCSADLKSPSSDNKDSYVLRPGKISGSDVKCSPLVLICSVCVRVKHFNHMVAINREKSSSVSISSSSLSCANCRRPFVRVSGDEIFSPSHYSPFNSVSLSASDYLLLPSESSVPSGCKDLGVDVKENDTTSSLSFSWITSSEDFETLPYILSTLPLHSLFIRVFRVV
jgi:hypothetical protein